MANRSQDKGRRRQERLAAERAHADARERRRTQIILGASALAVIAAVVIVVSGAGRNDKPTLSSAPSPPASRAELAGLSKGVAENLRQANRIIDTPIKEKLASLKGVPVVVNQWASWCPSCKAEFGFFQRLAGRYRGRVAFVGLDSQDDRGDAEAFLKQFPVDYPSIYDHSAAQARSLGGGQGWPTTIFFDGKGQRTYVRPGGYTTLATLDADIRRYALS
ncbi:MAG TPA: TlpA disulfide reductase family protein [Solirubrobacteraceae bacterium]